MEEGGFEFVFEHTVIPVSLTVFQNIVVTFTQQ